MARKKIIPIFVTHMGCPHQCVFCNQNRIAGSLLPATSSDVEKAVDNARKIGVYGAQLAFYGGSFTAVPASMQERLLEEAVKGMEDGTVESIRLSTRPDAINEEVVERLRRYHVQTVELGSQSMDDGVLRLSGRGHSAEDTIKAAALLKKAGFELVLQMMTGLPGSSREKDIRTAEKIIQCRPDAVRIYPTVIVRDTPLYDMWKKGEYTEHSVEDAVAVCADILPLFHDAGIPVIRLGLNPTEELSAGAAVAGAYHPALGEMVRSEFFFRMMREKLQNVPDNAILTILTAPKQSSAVVGNKKINIQKLQDIHHFKAIYVQENEKISDFTIELQIESE